jgi:hypothetical protein
MAYHEISAPKLDENGEKIILNGDFVMEVVSITEVPDVIDVPDPLSNIVVTDFNNQDSFNALIKKLQEIKI